jgi:hypothetical protein
VTIKHHGAAAAARVEAEAVDSHLDDLMAAMAGCFRRWEPRLQAKKYVRALMSDLPRKNCWTIEEHAGDATPDKMQHLLERAKWDTMGAMAAVRGFVCERLDDGYAVAILDESGQEKKGTATIGVKRQYVGCAGRVFNAINVVYCGFATKAGHALVGARLYLPAEQAADPDHRRQTRVPEAVAASPPRAHHGRPGCLCGHRRPGSHDNRQHGTATDQPQRCPASRSRADRADRRRGETPGRPTHPQPTQPGAPPALAYLATTTPSPRPLVPPTNPPHPPVI